MRTTALVALLTILGIGAARAESGVALEAATDRKFYREGGETEVYVEARIRATGAPTDEATGAAAGGARNIALVLDRSGSMAGDRIQALRQALIEAVDSLSDRDVVSVVLFGSEVETLLEAQRRDQVHDLAARVAQIESAGGAALFDALNQGAAQLRRYADPSTIDHLILVSDGPPTKGPREFDDFARLAGVFANEGTIASTIGIGDEFDEDLLAAFARIGNGRFRYVDEPGKLAAALQAEISPTQAVVAHDAVLTLEFNSNSSEVESHGWESATVERTIVTYRFPHLLQGRDTSVLASGKVRAPVFSGMLSNAVTVRLRWRGIDGAAHELSKVLPIHFTSEDWAIRDSIDVDVFRAAVNAVISGGMQDAIEHLDKGDYRRALRALRSARNEATALNFRLDDTAITESVRKLEAYLAEIQARGMNQLDRKILRSGLFNQFDSPTDDEKN